MRHVPHAPYYHDRNSEYELCNDFPGDVVLIDGLHSMQSHFWNNNVKVDIPVVRVMNTAHFLASYMFSTECSGDQLEYDAIAHDSIGRDKQLVQVAMIVLAAMLKRTKGFRARNCRSVILDNRPPDFEEGVTLYDRFLRSAETRFAEEDFLIDTHAQIQRLQAENQQLTSENIQLKYAITTMEKDKPQTIVYNYGTYNDIHDNPHSTIYTTAPSAPADSEPVCEDITPVQEKPDKKGLFCRITKAAYEKGVAQQVEDDLCSACVSAPKLVKALNTNDALGYTDTKNLYSSELYDLLDEHYGLPFKKHHFTVCRSK